MLRKEGFFDQPEQRLLLFTEFKDTLDYLVDRLGQWGFRVGFIHGGMNPARVTSRARDCTPNSNSAKARSRSSLRPRRRARGSTFRSATSCSTTTFRGIPTA